MMAYKGWLSICLLLNTIGSFCLEFVSISGKRLLHDTSRGKNLSAEVTKEGDKLAQDLDVKKAIVVESEKDLLRLQEKIQNLANQYQSQGMSEEQELELNRLLDQYEAEQQELLELNILLQNKADKYKEYLHKKKVEKLSSFDQDIIQRYAPLQGWDMVFSIEQPSVLHVSKKLDKTNQLIGALDKQLLAKKDVYTTQDEVKQLFQKLGIVYLNDINVDSEVSGDINAFYTERYEKDRANLDGYRYKFLTLVKQYYRAPISVQWVSEQVGFGVFALKDIKTGDFIQEYTGTLRKQIGSKGMPFDASYAWDYPAVGAYVNNELAVDSKYAGNEMRFVNHSNHPNLKMVQVLDDKGMYHICYIAMQDIKAGEQLTVSYGMGYWSLKDFFEDL